MGALPRTSSPSPGTTSFTTFRPTTRAPAWCSPALAVLTMESCASWLRRTSAKLESVFPTRLLLICTAGTLDQMCASVTTRCPSPTSPLPWRVVGGPAVHINRSLVGNTDSNFAKVLLSELAQLSMVNTASAGEHHAGALVVGLNVVSQVVPGDGLDVLSGAQDGPAKGGALVGDGVQVVEDDLL